LEPGVWAAAGRGGVDEEGMRTMKQLGRNMAWLMKQVKK
jgi:hypothetical protein